MGRKVIAWGSAPGIDVQVIQALKGRNTYVALTVLDY